MSKRLLDFNPLTGESVTFEYNPDDTMRITHNQDVSAILSANRDLANNDELTARGIKKDMWHYATIPNILIQKWKQEKGVDVFDKAHRKKVFSLLNSPEYAYLKTTRKHHGG